LNEKYGVILLDSSLAFHEDDEAPDGSVSFDGPAPDSPDSPQPPPPGDEDEPGEPPPPFPEENDEPDEDGEIPPTIDDGEDEPSPTSTLTEEEEFPLLDPDDTSLAFTSRPFKKMELSQFVIPMLPAELEKRARAGGSGQLFHPDIFGDLYEQIRTMRKKRVRDADREILAALPAESGRDRLLEDLEVYAEDFGDDDDLPAPAFPEPPQDARAAYNELCRRFIEMMVEMGKQRVLKPVSSEVLEDWERKLTPKLDKEAKRKPFNVREVRQWIADVLRTSRGIVAFKALCSGLAPYEVPRVFLSVLMLANAGEVTLDGVTPGECSENFFVALNENVRRHGSDSE
jgi:hypothetical protein